MVWSYSRIASFEDCPYKWFMTYLYRDAHGKPLQRKSGFFAEYGRYIHLILQMYLSGILRHVDLPGFYVAHFRDNVRAKAPTPKIYHNYFEQGFHYFDTISLPKRKILGVEQHIDFTFAGKPFTGFLDVVSDDGRLIITDHKSRALKPRSKRAKPTKGDMELDAYLRQLYIYAAAVKKEYGRFPDILEFNCFRSQTIIQQSFDINRFHAAEQWVEEQISYITNNRSWTAKPEYWRCNYLCDLCGQCEYRMLV